ncbi:MAG: putative toxin-antitoxin system toxin component, PIN family [Clostridia bacterium]|jgi:putative PIN family toxin of toxin-antitoxin system|nr:putative toxin-antitoxin system toxin component, PIN family [Clostridia bacterium]
MRFFAVIDTNVLVSAAMKPESVPGKVLELVLDGLIIPIFNKAIMKEYRNVLLRPKFAFSEQIVTDILNEMSDRGICVDAERLTVDLPDPKDIVFYEVVMEERKEEDAYLVTGNIRHFPNKPFIVTPREMIDIILEAVG